ncbi:MAG: NAD-dependent deacetylase [Nitrospiria bacterium]
MRNDEDAGTGKCGGDLEASIDDVRRRVFASKSLVVLTGAGVSAESGIPTFRGDEGLWKTHRAEDLATPGAFARDPTLVWSWYQWRRGLIASKKTNAAHEALARLEARAARYLLITQNVDGLHALAGSRNMIMLHGDIWRMRCMGCGQKMENRDLDLPPLPTCAHCADLLRPDIVWFGEAIDSGHLTRSIAECRACDLMLVIGTSAVVQPAASFASMAKDSGAFVVEINPAPALSGLADVTLCGKAAEVVPKIVEENQSD